jgi:hypothetical protein
MDMDHAWALIALNFEFVAPDPACAVRWHITWSTYEAGGTTYTARCSWSMIPSDLLPSFSSLLGHLPVYHRTTQSPFDRASDLAVWLTWYILLLDMVWSFLIWSKYYIIPYMLVVVYIQYILCPSLTRLVWHCPSRDQLPPLPLPSFFWSRERSCWPCWPWPWL